MNYIIHLLILSSLYLLLAQGLNVILGLGNMFSLAHISLFSIGAYVTALGATEYIWPYWVCVPASALAAALTAFLVGAIAARLKSDYFAIGSLALASMVSALEINWKSLTKGVLGIAGIPRPLINGEELIENSQFLIFSASIMVVSLFICYLFWKSTTARRLMAQAEMDEAAMSLGINTSLVRNTAFFIGSFMAGIAGSLFSYFMSYIDPSSFAINEMVFVLTIVVVGRPGSFWGVTLSTLFFVLFPEALRFLDIPSEILGPTRQMLYASILFIVVFWNRRILFPQKREI